MVVNLHCHPLCDTGIYIATNPLTHQNQSISSSLVVCLKQIATYQPAAYIATYRVTHPIQSILSGASGLSVGSVLTTIAW